MGELGGLLPDVRMVPYRRMECIGQTCARGVAQRCRLRQELLSLLLKCADGLAQIEELLFRLASQCHEDVPVPAALATKAPHDVFHLLLEAVGMALHLRGPAAAPLGDPCNHLEGFFVPYTAWWHR